MKQRKQNKPAAQPDEERRPELLGEIRAILKGNVAVAPDGCLMDAEVPAELFAPSGFAGSLSATLFGVKSVTETYPMRDSAEALFERCMYACGRMGRMLRLKADANGLSILSIPLVRNPAVIRTRLDGSSLVMTVYTARTPWASLSCRRFAGKMKKLMACRTVGTLKPAAEADASNRQRNGKQSETKQKTSPSRKKNRK